MKFIFCLSMIDQITKASIKHYQLGRRIPHCGFEFQLVSEKSSLGQQICHEVFVTGVSNLTTFHIRYPQTEGMVKCHILCGHIENSRACLSKEGKILNGVVVIITQIFLPLGVLKKTSLLTFMCCMPYYGYNSRV